MPENSLNPHWEEETIDLFQLCNGNFNLPLVLSIFHHKSNGDHVLMGEVEVTMNTLISAGKVDSSSLRIKKKGFNTGIINVEVASIS